MRIAILNAYNPYAFKGGAEVFALNLSNFLKAKGYSVDILYPEIFNIEEDKFFYNFALNLIRVKNEYEMFISSPIVSHYLIGENIKLINVFHMCFSQMAESCRNGIPKVVYLSWKYITAMQERISGLIGKNVAVSQSLKSELSTNYGLKNISVLNHFVDTNQFKPINKASLRDKYKIPKDAFVGLYVGRTDYAKGYDLFEELVNMTQRDILWIQVLSSGGLKQYEPIPIKTFDSVEYALMPEIYNLADFVFFPTRYEGFGMATIEALACGVPVISTDTGVFSQLGDVWEELKIFHPADDFERAVLDSLRSIKLLKEHKALREHLGKLGVQVVRKRFNRRLWEKKVLEVLDLDRG